MRKTNAIAASAVALTLAGTMIPTQANAAKVKFGASLDDSVPRPMRCWPTRAT